MGCCMQSLDWSEDIDKVHCSIAIFLLLQPRSSLLTCIWSSTYKCFLFLCEIFLLIDNAALYHRDETTKCHVARHGVYLCILIHFVMGAWSDAEHLLQDLMSNVNTFIHLIWGIYISRKQFVWYYQAGAKAILLTLGPAGAALLRRIGNKCMVMHIPAIPAELKNTSGAGDCLVAGFCAAILAGSSQAEALAQGLVCSLFIWERN